METLGDTVALLRAILDGAAREAAELEAAASGEAARLEAGAEKEAAAAGLALVEAARAEGARRREMLLASVPAEAARLRAARLEGLLEAVRSETLALLSAEARGPGLARLAALAMAGIGGRAFVLRGAPGGGLKDLAAQIEKAVPGAELRFEEDPAMTGGAAAFSADGRLRWDNGPAAMLERAWPGLRTGLAAELDGGGKDGR